MGRFNARSSLVVDVVVWLDSDLQSAGRGGLGEATLGLQSPSKAETTKETTTAERCFEAIS